MQTRKSLRRNRVELTSDGGCENESDDDEYRNVSDGGEYEDETDKEYKNESEDKEYFEEKQPKRTRRSCATNYENNSQNKDDSLQFSIPQSMGIDQNIVHYVQQLSWNEESKNEVKLRTDALLFSVILLQEYAAYLGTQEASVTNFVANEEKMPMRLTQLSRFLESNKDAIITPSDLAKMMQTTSKTYLRNLLSLARKQKVIAITEPLWKKDTPNTIKPVTFRYVRYSSPRSWEFVITEQNLDKVLNYIKQHGTITLNTTCNLLSITIQQARFFFSHYIGTPKATGIYIKMKLDNDILFTNNVYDRNEPQNGTSDDNE